MKMNVNIECYPYHVEFFFYRWRHSFVDPKLSCQGKGSQKDCCSAGPTLVLVDLHPEFMIFGFDNKDYFLVLHVFCISGRP